MMHLLYISVIVVLIVLAILLYRFCNAMAEAVTILLEAEAKRLLQEIEKGNGGENHES